ncbi:MAG: hypothetical protein WDO71_28295 [Bacteroidota bacterium]
MKRTIFIWAQITRLRKPPKVDPDYYFVHAIHQLQIEGMADMLDIKAFPSVSYSATANNLYNTAYIHSYNVFRTMDSLVHDSLK